jgi:hypothetical protein
MKHQEIIPEDVTLYANNETQNCNNCLYNFMTMLRFLVPSHNYVRVCLDHQWVA